ncbi:MAG: hypothetical protein ACRELX_12890, partial [Longimicrobiales bacterium]
MKRRGDGLSALKRSDETLAIAASLGAATGLRSMTGMAFLVRELAGRHRRVARRMHDAITDAASGADPIRRVLTSPRVSRFAPALAVGELVADKLPSIPARIARGPLI